MAVMNPHYSDFNKQALVTFSYDDGNASVYTLARPLHLQYNMPGTFNIITSLTGQNKTGYVNSTQVKEMSDVGLEIASHSHTHPAGTTYFNQLTTEQTEYEAVTSNQYLRNLGLPRVEGIAIPGSKYADFQAPILKQYYRYARCYKGRTSLYNQIESGNYEIMPYPPIDNYDLSSQAIFGDTSVEQVKSWIDQAISQKKWLIIMMHYLVDSGTSDTYEWHINKLEQVFQYINSKPKSQLLPINSRDAIRFANGLGDYSVNSITLSKEKVSDNTFKLTSKGFDDYQNEVSVANGYNLKWEIVRGNCTLSDNLDGTANLTVLDASNDIIVRCSDYTDNVFTETTIVSRTKCLTINTPNGIENIPIYALNDITSNNVRVFLNSQIQCLNLVDVESVTASEVKLYIGSSIKALEKS